MTCLPETDIGGDLLYRGWCCFSKLLSEDGGKVEERVFSYPDCIPDRQQLDSILERGGESIAR